MIYVHIYNWITLHRIIIRFQVLNKVFSLLKTAQIHTFVTINLITLSLTIPKQYHPLYNKFLANLYKAEREGKKSVHIQVLEFTTCGSTICIIESTNLSYRINIYQFLQISERAVSRLYLNRNSVWNFNIVGSKSRILILIYFQEVFKNSICDSIKCYF